MFFLILILITSPLPSSGEHRTEHFPMEQFWENWHLHSESVDVENMQEQNCHQTNVDDEEFLRDIILQQPATTYSGSSLSSSKEMNGSDCSGNNPSTTLSNTPRTFILSFDTSTIIPATSSTPRIKSRKSNNDKRCLELPEVKVSSSAKGGKKSRNDSQCLDHIMAERKRRADLAHKFIALSATIPGLKKLDKSTILCEAINYVKLLQERVKVLELEDPNKIRTKEPTIILKTTDDDLCANEHTTTSNDDTNFNYKSLPVPDIKARVLKNEVLIEINCEKINGIELKILKQLENLHLIVTASSVLPFGNSALGITIVAQMSEMYKLTGNDLVKILQQVVLNIRSPPMEIAYN